MRILVWATLTAALLADPVFGQENLLVDPSFERAALGANHPAGWGHWQPDGSRYRASVVTEAHTGSRAVLLEGEGTVRRVQLRGVRHRPRRCLSLRRLGAAGGDGADGAVKLDLLRKDGSWLCDMSASRFGRGTPGWQSVLMVSRFGDAPEAARFRIVAGLGGKGRLWVDDVFLAKASPPGPGALLVNGDMELAAQEAVAGWQGSHDAAAEARLAPATDGVHGGKTALRIEGKGTWASAGSMRAAVPADRGYGGSAWVRVREGNARLQIVYWGV